MLSKLLTRASPDAIILRDDPAFAIDMPPPPPDLDFSNFDINRDSQRSSQSMLSIRGRSGSVVSHTSSVLGINLPSSNGGSYQLPMLDAFGNSSASKLIGSGIGIFNEDEEMIFQDDDLFDFDADGQLRDIPASEREARHVASINPQRRLGSDSAASGRVRKEHEDAFAGRVLPAIDGDGDFNMPQYGDNDFQMDLNAEPFAMAGVLGGSDRPLHLSNEDRIRDNTESDSSVTADAPLVKQRVKKIKTMKMDPNTEITSGQLKRQIESYVEDMEAATRVKVNHKAATQAKKNALFFTYGAGLNGVGDGIGSLKFANPLAMFSGDALMTKVTGRPIITPAPKRGAKRANANDDDEQDESPSKRVREDEFGRGNFDDDMMLNMDDDQFAHSHEQSVELGRDAPSALADHPPSAMPWNTSASLHSHQKGRSSSIQGRAGIFSSQLGSAAGRRMTSPLIGRGSALPNELDGFSQLMNDDNMVMYGRSDSAAPSQASGFPVGGGMRSSSIGMGGGPVGAVDIDDFEIFGAAAGVDTQTAGSSQWMKDVMDRESNNFLEYVRNTIQEKTGDEVDEFAEEQDKNVTFEELFDPQSNSCIVAAQAFYHVLSLATNNRVWVSQEVDERLEPFGDIRIGVCA